MTLVPGKDSQLEIKEDGANEYQYKFVFYF